MIAVHLENGRVAVRNSKKPRRPAGLALIRLLYGGICNTDLELNKGYLGFSGTPGHEFVGEVVDADDSNWLGRRVVGEINLACRRCQWCNRGLGRHCPRRTVLGIVKHPGAFAEFLSLPEINLHQVPKSIPSEIAVFVEPLAAACEILEQVRIPPHATVAVLGDGKLGLLVAMALKAEGCNVHQFGRHRNKLAITHQVGIHTSISGTRPPEREYEWVVEATGTSEGLKAALAMTRPRGTVIMKSTIHRSVAVDTAGVIINEVTLVGSRCGRFEPALQLLRTRRIDPAPMISDVFSLSDAPAAFKRAAEPGVLKVLLKPAP